MLILMRRSGERILIGDNIYLKVVKVDSWTDSITVEIEAPDDVSIEAPEKKE